MRIVLLTLWLMAFIAPSVLADESTAVSSAQVDAAQVDSAQAQTEAPESIEPESAAASEEKADADIRRIEQGVSGAEEVEEFIPDKPLSADKAISLPSDI
jgi:hypothetical protein